MIDCWAVLDRNDKTSWTSAICALRFVRTRLGIENAARMNCCSHRNHYFAVSDLNLIAHLHNVATINLLGWKVGELRKIACEFGISNQSSAGLFGDRNRIADMVAMTVREQDVVNFWNGHKRILPISRFRV